MTFEKNWQSGIYSDGSKYFVSNPLPKKGETVTIAVQLLENSPVTGVFLAGKRNGTMIPQKMKPVSAKNGLVRYEVSVQIFEDEFSYQFFISTAEKKF